MVYGNIPEDAGGIPLSSGIVPGRTIPVPIQSSANTTTDNQGNETTPVNLNLKQVGDVLFALGQALKVGSIPVVLPSDQTVSVLDTNSAAIKADLDTIATNTGHIPSSPATEGGHLATIDTNTAASKADLDTLAGIVSGGKGAVQDIEAAGYIALTSPPSTTNVGSDTPLTFSSQVNRVIIQNNTNANVNFDFDQAASAGSFLVGPGGLIVYPKKCTVFHLFTAAAQNINGSSGNNIVIRGAM